MTVAGLGNSAKINCFRSVSSAQHSSAGLSARFQLAVNLNSLVVCAVVLIIIVAAFVWQTTEMPRSFRRFHAMHRCLVLRHMATSIWEDQTSEEMPELSRTRKI